MRKSPSKYHAKKVIVDNVSFDSKKEAEYYKELKLLQRAGEIQTIRLQVPFELQPGFVRAGKKVRPITYIADFVISLPNGSHEVIDVKGYKTDVYRLKQKMLLYRYPDIIFKEV